MKKNGKIIVCTIFEKDKLLDYALLSAKWKKHNTIVKIINYTFVKCVFSVPCLI